MSKTKKLHTIFSPRSVAVIGAKETEEGVGYRVVSNILAAGFAGQLIPARFADENACGLAGVSSVTALPAELDLAILCVPAEDVVAVLEQLASLHCAAVMIMSAGFKEIGSKGQELEHAVVEVCEKANMALLGPNCLGIANAHAGLNASLVAGTPLPGSIGFFSQSGALCSAMLDWAMEEPLGISTFASLGNKAALDEVDILQYFEQDEQTSVVLGYVEDVERGEAFLSQGEQTSRSKPVIMVKSGIVGAGAKAGSLRSGNPAGADHAYDTAFRKAGIIRVDDISSLFHMARAFVGQPLPVGPGVAVVTNAGGPGVLAADAIERTNLCMSTFSGQTIALLQEKLPQNAACHNPVNLLADADPDRYAQALKIVAADPLVHTLIAVFAPLEGADADGIGEAILRVAMQLEKPVFAVFMGRRTVACARRKLEMAGVPCHSFPLAATHCIQAMYSYRQWQQCPAPTVPSASHDISAAANFVAVARQKGEEELVRCKALDLLAAHGLPVAQSCMVSSKEEAVAAAERIGFPVVLQKAGAEAFTPTVANQEYVYLENPDSMERVFAESCEETQGICLEELFLSNECVVQAAPFARAQEVVAGFQRHRQFGPLLSFGPGGEHLSIAEERVFRLAPLTVEDARGLIREVFPSLLLRGLHGEQEGVFEALENILLALSQLATALPEILEAELGPIFVNGQGASIAGARFVLRPL